MPPVSGISFPRLHCRQGRQHQDQSHFVGLISLEPSCSAVLSLCIVAKIGLIMADGCCSKLRCSLCSACSSTEFDAGTADDSVSGDWRCWNDWRTNNWSSLQLLRIFSFFCSCSRSRRRNSQPRVLNFIQYTDLRTSMIWWRVSRVQLN